MQRDRFQFLPVEWECRVLGEVAIFPVLAGDRERMSTV